MLDLGRQTRYGSLDSEPRNHAHFLVCISLSFSYSLVRIIINELVHKLTSLFKLLSNILFYAQLILI